MAYVATAILTGRAPQPSEGWSVASQMFDASVILLAITFGWNERRTWRPIVWGAANPKAAFGYVCATIAATILAAFLQSAITPPTESLAASRTLPPIVLLGFLGPVAETLIFQGWLQTAIQKHLDARWALVLASLAFWAVHLEFRAPLIVAVLALCFIRLRTGSLATVILAHAGVNFAILAMTLMN